MLSPEREPAVLVVLQILHEAEEALTADQVFQEAEKRGHTLGYEPSALIGGVGANGGRRTLTFIAVGMAGGPQRRIIDLGPIRVDPPEGDAVLRAALAALLIESRTAGKYAITGLGIRKLYPEGCG